MSIKRCEPVSSESCGKVTRSPFARETHSSSALQVMEADAPYARMDVSVEPARRCWGILDSCKCPVGRFLTHLSRIENTASSHLFRSQVEAEWFFGWAMRWQLRFDLGFRSYCFNPFCLVLIVAHVLFFDILSCKRKMVEGLTGSWKADSESLSFHPAPGLKRCSAILFALLPSSMCREEMRILGA